MEAEMTPSRPYLLRAFYDWIVDNDMTPHLLVNTKLPLVKVPMQFAQDGQIVLNIAPRAVMAWSMDNDGISFNARFSGQPFAVYVPMAAVIAIHARENGVGTMFPPEPGYEDWVLQHTHHSDDEPTPPRPTGRPSLKVVK